MSQLDLLIENSERGLGVKNSLVSKLKYPGLFVSSLKELRDLVGNETIKDSIAAQLTYLITNKDVKRDVNAQPVMLNTILYGPPGTGKTAISVKLAKIWYAMGFIQGSDKSSTLSSIYSMMTMENITLIFLYGYILYLLGSILFLKIANFYNYVGAKYCIIIIGIILFVCIVIYLFNTIGYSNRLNNAPVKDSDVVTIVSREDFIDKYLGGTDKKTKALLIANNGKVLFIDEAYSLCNGEHDPYGMEAITTINRYLSEHPDKILVVMAGYKGLIKDKILKQQPGLASRFMWQFECNGYNAQELCKIFHVMIKKDGWTLARGHKRPLYQLVSANLSAFKAFARDMQRLMFFSQLEHSKSMISGEPVNERELTIGTIDRGLKVLIQNNIDNDNDGASPSKNTNNDISPETIKDIIDIMNQRKNLTSSREDSFRPNIMNQSKNLTQSQEDSFLPDNSELSEVDNIISPATKTNLDKLVEMESKMSGTVTPDKLYTDLSKAALTLV